MTKQFIKGFFPKGIFTHQFYTCPSCGSNDFLPWGGEPSFRVLWHAKPTAFLWNAGTCQTCHLSGAKVWHKDYPEPKGWIPGIFAEDVNVPLNANHLKWAEELVKDNTLTFGRDLKREQEEAFGRSNPSSNN